MKATETNLLRRNTLSLYSVQKLVEGKNVLLVGNSIMALQREQGELIDSYDIVVRFGKGVPEGKEKYIGAKTDIWCTGGFRTALRDKFPDAKEVIFNQASKIKGGIDLPEFEHTLMYTEDEVDEINRMHGQTGNKRLSTGAIAAYFFHNKVKTQSTLTFINFDMFSYQTKFFAKPWQRPELAGSWHLPIPTKNSYDITQNGKDHPAHDIEVEKRLINNIRASSNVFFLGDVPSVPEIVEIENASWDSHRQKLETK